MSINSTHYLVYIVVGLSAGLHEGHFQTGSQLPPPLSGNLSLCLTVTLVAYQQPLRIWISVNLYTTK